MRVNFCARVSTAAALLLCFLLAGCENKGPERAAFQAEQKQKRAVWNEAVLPIYHSYFKYVQHDPDIQEQLRAGIDENGRLRTEFGKSGNEDEVFSSFFRNHVDRVKFSGLRDFNGERLTYKIYEDDFDYYQDLESKYPEKVAALYEK